MRVGFLLKILAEKCFYFSILTLSILDLSYDNSFVNLFKSI